ncbi:MAG: Mur ligase family protein [Planctomycetota bacterium]
MSGFWALDNLRRVTGGRWLTEPDDPAAAAAGLSHDTRTLRPGQAYLAVRGENHDGHDFVDTAFDAGASVAITEAAGAGPSAAGSRPRLAVDDTVVALQQLAAAYRNVLTEHDCRVISVSGSNGKTTTRHLIHHVLTTCGVAGTQSPKSFNNHLGVPLTLLAADPTRRFVACEVGTNRPGEIAALSAIVWPDVAVITSLGEEHLEGFGDLAGVVREEAKVIRFVRPGGTLIVTSLGGRLALAAQPPAKGVRKVVLSRADVVPAGFPLPGEHNRINAAVALAVAEEFGVNPAAARDALRTATPPEGRSQPLGFGSVVVLNDAYNANPTSMRHALDTARRLAATRGSRRVLVLGDMFELGAVSGDRHRVVAEAAAAELRPGDPTRVIVLIGQAFAEAAAASDHPVYREKSRDEGQVHVVGPWHDALPGVVAGLLREGDTVLLKGSRGMRLERLLPAIEKRFGSGAVDDIL